MKSGDKVTLEAEIGEIVDMGGDRNLRLDSKEGEEGICWIRESRLKALQSAPKNKAVKPQDTK